MGSALKSPPLVHQSIPDLQDFPLFATLPERTSTELILAPAVACFG
jgi:hypothetical protein